MAPSLFDPESGFLDFDLVLLISAIVGYLICRDAVHRPDRKSFTEASEKGRMGFVFWMEGSIAFTGMMLGASMLGLRLGSG